VFGTLLASTTGREEKLEDVVVTQVVNSKVYYAVIAGLRTETGAEYLVIAYPNEASLLTLIATPSIIARGFSSREEAVASCGASRPTTAAQKDLAESTSNLAAEKEKNLNWADQRSKEGSTLRRLAKFFLTTYSDVATTLMVRFSSRNAVSAVVRMALGSSV
jgi:hypothetical protein